MPHLKDYIFYNELYDQITIGECQRYEVVFSNTASKESISSKELEMQSVESKFMAVMLYFVKGNRYVQKSETIKQWQERDRARDEYEAKAMPPQGIRCLGCSHYMDEESRQLNTALDKKQEKVLFTFQCPKCGKRRAFWENSEEWKMSPYPCPKCHAHMSLTSSYAGEIITSTYTCPGCNHQEIDTLELGKKEEAVDPDFESQRQKYCLNDKEGMDYIQAEVNRRELEKIVGRQKNGEGQRVQVAVKNIKQLTIVEVEKLLTPILEEAGYVKFELGKPEPGLGFFIPFNVQDNKAGRAEYDSIHQLKRVIEKTLQDTNWRLMTEGISFRLGYLNGRIRGFSGEEELQKLINKNIG